MFSSNSYRNTSKSFINLCILYDKSFAIIGILTPLKNKDNQQVERKRIIRKPGRFLKIKLEKGWKKAFKRVWSKAKLFLEIVTDDFDHRQKYHKFKISRYQIYQVPIRLATRASRDNPLGHEQAGLSLEELTSKSSRPGRGTPTLASESYTSPQPPAVVDS